MSLTEHERFYVKALLSRRCMTSDGANRSFLIANWARLRCSIRLHGITRRHQHYTNNGILPIPRTLQISRSHEFISCGIFRANIGY
jgi:hypothetical protein